MTGFAFSTTSLGSGTDHNFSRSKWTDSATPISSNNINGEKIMPRPSGQFKVYNHPQGYPMEQYPYIVPEPEQPNTPVQSSTRDTISTASSVTSNCLLDQQNYYSVTASKGRSIPSPVPVPPAGSGFTNNYYYDETEISKAHLVTHQSNGYNR